MPVDPDEEEEILLLESHGGRLHSVCISEALSVGRQRVQVRTSKCGAENMELHVVATLRCYCVRWQRHESDNGH